MRRSDLFQDVMTTEILGPGSPLGDVSVNLSLTGQRNKNGTKKWNQQMWKGLECANMKAAPVSSLQKEGSHQGWVSSLLRS